MASSVFGIPTRGTHLTNASLSLRTRALRASEVENSGLATMYLYSSGANSGMPAPVNAEIWRSISSDLNRGLVWSDRNKVPFVTAYCFCRKLFFERCKQCLSSRGILIRHAHLGVKGCEITKWRLLLSVFELVLKVEKWVKSGSPRV